MATIAIVHHSGTGYTSLLAEAVAEGVLRVEGAKVDRYEILPSEVVEGRWGNEDILSGLDAADAVVFGCPTHMGSVSTPMKAFFDGSLQRWYGRVWSGKIAGGFTVSSTPSGDKLNAMQDMLTFALQHGMVWVGLDESPLNPEGINRLGFYSGAAAQPDYESKDKALVRGDLETGARLGARVAEFAVRLAAGVAKG